jgi:hypothetical protein
VPILHIGFPDDIFQLKLYKKFDQIAADSPHLEKNKADTICCVPLFSLQTFDILRVSHE